MSNIFDYKTLVSTKDRENIKSHKGKVLWLTGLSGSGKSTIANSLEMILNKKNLHTFLLDGDNVRKGLCKDLGFSIDDRKENIRRIAEVSKLFSEAGVIVITAFISPIENDRVIAKQIIGEKYNEIYCDCSIEECINRDTKGLYKKAISGQIKEFTGISSNYDIPTNPDIIVDTEKTDVEYCIEKILNNIDFT